MIGRQNDRAAAAASVGRGGAMRREHVLELRSILEAPLRRPLRVSLCFVLCVAASLAAFSTVPKRYRSSTLILVEGEKVPSSFAGQGTADPTRKRLYTLNQQVLSRTRLERIVTELAPYPRASPPEPMSATVDRMRDAIRIRVRGSDAFEIEYVHPDPAIAQRVAERITSLFIEEVASAREQQVEGASRFIEEQLAEARKGLEAQEAAVGRFKERNMGSLPEQVATNLSTLQRLQLEQQSVGQNLQAAQDRLAAMDAQLGTPEDRSSGEIRQLRTQLDELKGRYTDQHPDVRVLAARIAGMEASIATRSAPTDSHALAVLRLDIQGLKARSSEVDGRIAEIQASVDRSPRTEQELAILTRDYKKLSENYLALLNKKLDTQMAERMEKQWKGERFRILDPANHPERPFFPQLSVFLLVGVLGGIASGLGLALLAESLDHSIRTPADLEGALEWPVLATVGHVATPGEHKWSHPRRVAS